MIYRDCVCGYEIAITNDPRSAVEAGETFRCPRCGRYLELRFEQYIEDSTYGLEAITEPEPPAQG